jgi:hypothetical protein
MKTTFGKKHFKLEKDKNLAPLPVFSFCALDNVQLSWVGIHYQCIHPNPKLPEQVCEGRGD